MVIAEDEAAAERELVDADGAYGGVSADVLPNVERLRLLQNQFAGPPPGYYYEELAEHPVIVSNPRGIYSDHISQHIMMFMLALARGLPYWSAAQAEGRWDTKARKRGYVNLAELDGADQRDRRDRGGDRSRLRGLWRACDWR